jgi:hypothetical protein
VKKGSEEAYDARAEGCLQFFTTFYRRGKRVLCST